MVILANLVVPSSNISALVIVLDATLHRLILSVGSSTSLLTGTGTSIRSWRHTGPCISFTRGWKLVGWLAVSLDFEGIPKSFWL